MSLGGRAGARLARKLGLLASGPTLLRVLRKRPRPSVSSSPRVVGIDEWAWKKDHRYGAILCDLEQGRVIDLLPNRRTETVAAWLRQHPTVEVVSRDRASSFADAIAKGAPKAVQVADRWHLLNNLLETLMRSLERHRNTMTEVARQMVRKSTAPSPAEEHSAASTAAAQRTLQKREYRLGIYQDLVRLLDAGTSQSEASRQLGVCLRTVQRWLSYGGLSGAEASGVPEHCRCLRSTFREAVRRRLPEHYSALAGTQRTRLRRSGISGSRMAAASLWISQKGKDWAARQKVHHHRASAHRVVDAEGRPS